MSAGGAFLSLLGVGFGLNSGLVALASVTILTFVAYVPADSVCLAVLSPPFLRSSFAIGIGPVPFVMISEVSPRHVSTFFKNLHTKPHAARLMTRLSPHCRLWACHSTVSCVGHHILDCRPNVYCTQGLPTFLSAWSSCHFGTFFRGVIRKERGECSTFSRPCWHSVLLFFSGSTEDRHRFPS